MPLIPRQLALQMTATGLLLGVLDAVPVPDALHVAGKVHTPYQLPAGHTPQHVAPQLWGGTLYPPPGKSTVSSAQAPEGALQRSQENDRATGGADLAFLQ